MLVHVVTSQSQRGELDGRETEGAGVNIELDCSVGELAGEGKKNSLLVMGFNPTLSQTSRALRAVSLGNPW